MTAMRRAFQYTEPEEGQPKSGCMAAAHRLRSATCDYDQLGKLLSGLYLDGVIEHDGS